jgi:hypothetical protein
MLCRSSLIQHDDWMVWIWIYTEDESAAPAASSFLILILIKRRRRIRRLVCWVSLGTFIVFMSANPNSSVY